MGGDPIRGQGRVRRQGQTAGVRRFGARCAPQAVRCARGVAAGSPRAQPAPPDSAARRAHRRGRSVCQPGRGDRHRDPRGSPAAAHPRRDCGVRAGAHPGACPGRFGQGQGARETPRKAETRPSASGHSCGPHSTSGGNSLGCLEEHRGPAVWRRGCPRPRSYSPLPIRSQASRNAGFSYFGGCDQ